jgi:ABC-2 type transport system ATP-binding protein
VRIAGHDVVREADEVRKAIGVTGQFSAVTGEENLLLMADLNHLDRAEGRRRAAELLDRFDLADAARQTPMTYSGGMRRKLDLAMTLVGSRRTMWDAIRRLFRWRCHDPPHDAVPRRG